MERLELSTNGLKARSSSQLSYTPAPRVGGSQPALVLPGAVLGALAWSDEEGVAGFVDV